VIANSPLSPTELFISEQYLTNELRVSSHGQNLSEVLNEEHGLPIGIRAVVGNFAAALLVDMSIKTNMFCRSG
jgi:hypothetical protein